MAQLPKRDSTKATEGIWVPVENGIRFKVASVTTAGYVAAVERALKVCRPVSKKGVLDEERFVDLVQRATADFLLLDWENVDGEDGKPMRYTPDLGYQFLSDPDYRAIYDYVQIVAQDEGMFRTEEIAASGESSPVD